jgi:hypothetical protein
LDDSVCFAIDIVVNKRCRAFISGGGSSSASHGFHQVFSGMLSTSEAGVFFLTSRTGVVYILARGVGKGIKKFLEAFRLAEFAGEGGVDWHH